MQLNRRQKRLVVNLVIVFFVTVLSIFAMVNFKDWINRSEATRAMNVLSRNIMMYRKEHGMVPAGLVIDSWKEKLPGSVRLGDVTYRGRWLDLDSTGAEILAYTHKRYSSSFVGGGYLVLRLNGTVEWLDDEQFKVILEQQQSRMEREIRKSTGG